MSAAKFWPRESRNLIGPLTIELSTEVNCCEISMRPPSPRNKSAEVNVSLKDILVVLGELSSFLSLLRMAFGLTQAVSVGAEKYSNSEVCIPFYRIVSRSFHLKAFS